MFQCVYSIQCLDENIKEFYIGSTDDLQKRIENHMSSYNCINRKNYKVYKFIRENGGLSNWVINPIEIFSFLTELELRQHEQFYMDKYNPQLNSRRAYTNEEQRIEVEKEYSKEYYKKNIEKIKEYNQINKEIISLKAKKYREKNKEKRKEKGNCPHCDLEMRKDCISRHIKKYCKSTSTE
tara:strand:- start:430 stop:972 length:543 start_codon:yes stop_codon:yes gene_type:complete